MDPEVLTSTSCDLGNISVATAFAIVDFSGRTTTDFGNWDRCQDAGMSFCTLWLPTAIGFSPTGLCAPAGCGASDLRDVNSSLSVAARLLNPQLWLQKQQSQEALVFCGDNRHPWSASGIAVVACVGAVAVALLACTAVSSMWRPSKRSSDGGGKSGAVVADLVDGCSLRAGARAVGSLAPAQPSQLSVLHGVRVISMFLIILAHTLFFAQLPGYTNPEFFLHKLSSWRFQIVPSAELAVDTFFVLSGFLATLLLLKELTGLVQGMRKRRPPPSSATPTAETAADAERRRPLLGRSRMTGIGTPPGADAGDTGTALEDPPVTLVMKGLNAPSSDLVSGKAAEPEPAMSNSSRYVPAPATAVAKNVCGAIAVFVLHRVVRLLPLLGVLVAFTAYVLPSTGSGPFWHAMQNWAESCQDWGWTNVLFLNNIVPWQHNFQRQCLGYTWYIAIDMQLYVVTPLFVLAYMATPYAGKGLLLAALTASLVGGEETVRRNSLSSLMLSQAPSGEGSLNGDYENLFYAKPWTRAPAYLIGVALAFALWEHNGHRADSAPPTAPSQQQTVSATGARASSLSSVSIGADCPSLPAETHSEYQELPDHEPSASPVPHGIGSERQYSSRRRGSLVKLLLQPLAVLLCGSLLIAMWYLPANAYREADRGISTWSRRATTLYTAFSRPLWAVGVAGLLYLCFCGARVVAPIAWFLSWRAWQPFARLTYGAYLLHPMVMNYYLYTRTTLIRYSALELAYQFVANTVFSYALAALLFVVIEYPVGRLEKTALRAVGCARQPSVPKLADTISVRPNALIAAPAAGAL